MAANRSSRRSPTGRLTWVQQAEQRGTGHAVRLALGRLPAKDVVLVLYGDVPLVQPATLRELVRKAAAGRVAVLTADMPDPSGYGRILRAPAGRGGKEGDILAIVEHKDASAEQLAVREVNTGLLACPAARAAPGWSASSRRTMRRASTT